MNDGKTLLKGIGRHTGTVVAGVFTVLLMGAIVLLYFISTGMLSGAEATAVATVLLVLLTGVYATATYLMVQETQKAREQEIQPVLDFQAREAASTIVNSGNGPARSLDITLTLEPAGESRTIQRQSLPAGGAVAIPSEPYSSLGDQCYQDLQLQAADVDWENVDEDDPDFWENLDEPYQYLKLEGTCEDVWGNTHRINEEYQVYDLTEGTVGAIEPSMDEEASLELIAVELSRLRGTIDQLTKDDR
ncbi:hypothetical protein [Halobacterium wangiae]|uniref:hypothetical protein n=1 Tax=Halobacterium wangiae TaxID=2902623 RepID=UPI001E56BC57|nr:hypothetical protein [Halobacterium wangiae]